MSQAAQKWFAAEYQWDSRKFNSLHIAGTSPLPRGFAFWGFANLESPLIAENRTSDLTRYFLEFDVRSPEWNGMGLIFNQNSIGGKTRDVGRFGVYYRPSFRFLRLAGLFMRLKLFPVETDGKGGQASFSWRWRIPFFWPDRFSLGGFFDANTPQYNLDKVIIASELQFRLRLIGSFFSVCELRKNQFFPEGYQDGYSCGFRYRFDDTGT